jgi:putative endonuclease
MKPKDALGKYGEELAARRLAVTGLVILDRNWRCDLGEIDIVARDGSDLVVCEVKTRRSDAFGAPLEAVSGRKIRRMRSLALRWLEQKNVNPKVIRFDVVGIVQPLVGPPQITHIRGV